MKKIILLTIISFFALSPTVYAQIPDCPSGQAPVLRGSSWVCVDAAPAGSSPTQNVVVTPNSYGALGYTPLEPIPGITTNAAGGQLDFPGMLGNIYKIAIIIGALFSVLMLTISGIRYMLSDIVTDKERAKQRIKACIYGLVLIAASWLILNTINPQLVMFTLNPGEATINAQLPLANTGAPTAQQLEAARLFQSQQNISTPLNSSTGGIQPVSP
jgi:hypothetical protein